MGRILKGWVYGGDRFEGGFVAKELDVIGYEGFGYLRPHCPE